MCSPTVAIGAVTALGGTYLQQQQQEAMVEAEQARHEAEVQRAERDAEIQQNINDQQALDESYELQRERENLALEGLRSRANIKASSAEAGLGGVSTIRSFLSSDLAENREVGVLNMNEETRLTKHHSESLGISRNMNDRIYSSSERVANAKRQRLGPLDYVTSATSGAGRGYLMNK